MTSRQSRLRQSSGSEAVADILFIIHNPQPGRTCSAVCGLWIFCYQKNGVILSKWLKSFVFTAFILNNEVIALSLHKISCARQFENKFSLLSFALSLQEHNQRITL